MNFHAKVIDFAFKTFSVHFFFIYCFTESLRNLKKFFVLPWQKPYSIKSRNWMKSHYIITRRDSRYTLVLFALIAQKMYCFLGCKWHHWKSTDDPIYATLWMDAIARRTQLESLENFQIDPNGIAYDLWRAHWGIYAAKKPMHFGNNLWYQVLKRNDNDDVGIFFTKRVLFSLVRK